MVFIINMLTACHTIQTGFCEFILLCIILNILAKLYLEHQRGNLVVISVCMKQKSYSRHELIQEPPKTAHFSSTKVKIIIIIFIWICLYFLHLLLHPVFWIQVCLFATTLSMFNVLFGKLGRRTCCEINNVFFS